MSFWQHPNVLEYFMAINEISPLEAADTQPRNSLRNILNGALLSRVSFSSGVAHLRLARKNRAQCFEVVAFFSQLVSNIQSKQDDGIL